MKMENYISIRLTEDADGTNHKIEIDARWKDSHHFLDMIAAAIDKWRNQEHS